jgi:3-phenylpropionate/trans-cinnamate dioxygenase ferredoxin reductase subunit
VPGSDLAGIHYLRTIADVDGIRADLAAARRLVVVGAGYIGLEAAASARHLGIEVTVLEMADRPMHRVVAPQISAFYAERHAREGVDLRCNESVTAFAGDGRGRVRTVVCGEHEFPADLVIAGVGILPETSLAAAAGLRCENGIWVDEACRTSDPDIYAAGDCTFHPSVHYGPPRPSRVGRQRGRAGEDRGAEHLRPAGATRARAVVLVRSVRPEAADRGTDPRL